MARSEAWTRPGLISLKILLIAAVCCWSFGCAARPGGDNGVRLTTYGSVVLEDGSILEEYEVGTAALCFVRAERSVLMSPQYRAVRFIGAVSTVRLETGPVLTEHTLCLLVLIVTPESCSIDRALYNRAHHKYSYPCQGY